MGGGIVNALIAGISVSLGSVVKNLPASVGAAGDRGSIPRWGSSPGGGNGSPFQYSHWDNPMGRGAWWTTSLWVHKELDMNEHAHMHSDKYQSPYSYQSQGNCQRSLKGQNKGMESTVFHVFHKYTQPLSKINIIALSSS